jgi:MFS transporter, SP family, sugar:H+ symporter
MESFLTRFFPEVLPGPGVRDAYCKYDNQMLTAFTSSLYIAGTLSSLVASRVTRRVGRQAIMLAGGVLFLLGSVINAAAANVATLIVGRLLLGFGVGFTTQAAPLYLAETSPARWRGAFTGAYHSFLCAGTVAANVVNYFTNPIPGWGWRVSLGAAAVPALIIVVGALFVPDSPSSLMLRGRPEEARASLQRIRGADSDVEAEFKEIAGAAEEARRHEDGALKRLRGRGYRPYAVIMVAIPAFFDFTGFIVIFIFAPVLFRTVGFSSGKALLGSVIINTVGLFAVVVSTFVVDRYGRRFLFMAGGVSMLLCQVAVSWILADHLGTTTMASKYAEAVVALMCLYTFSLGMSWGPLKWVVWGEINPLDVRSVAQAITLSVTFILSFVQSQVFLALLCHLKYAIFLFYAAWMVAMTVFVAGFLPETKGVPLEAMHIVFARHWYWKRYIKNPQHQEAGLSQQGVNDRL